jgi:hypothetical protein
MRRAGITDFFKEAQNFQPFGHNALRRNMRFLIREQALGAAQ